MVHLKRFKLVIYFEPNFLTIIIVEPELSSHEMERNTGFIVYSTRF